MSWIIPGDLKNRRNCGTCRFRQVAVRGGCGRVGGEGVVVDSVAGAGGVTMQGHLGA